MEKAGETGDAMADTVAASAMSMQKATVRLTMGLDVTAAGASLPGSAGRAA